jgi:hypothetical protein
VFDLNIYPIHVKKSVEQLEMPGLMAANAPARCARNRQGDLIVVMATLQGAVPFSAMSIDKHLSDLINVYYQSSGPVTSGIRAAAEEYNNVLLDYNLNTTSSGKQLLGVVNFAVVHNQDLYLAHCGVTSSYHLTRETAIYTDNDSAGRGLGLSRTVSLRFFHMEITPGDYLLLTVQPPISWTVNNLTNTGSITLDTLRRRLFAQTPPDLRAVLISLMDGSGMVNMQPVMSSHSPIETPEGFGLVNTPIAPSVMMSSAVQDAVATLKRNPPEKPVSAPSVSPWATVDQILRSKMNQPAAEAETVQASPSSHPSAPRGAAPRTAASSARSFEADVDTETIERVAHPRPNFAVAAAAQPVPASQSLHSSSPRMSAGATAGAMPFPRQPAWDTGKSASTPDSRPAEDTPIRHTRSRRTGPRSVNELFDLVKNRAASIYDQASSGVSDVFHPLKEKEEEIEDSLEGVIEQGEKETESFSSRVSQIASGATGFGQRMVTAVRSFETKIHVSNPFKSVNVPTSAMVFLAVVIPLVMVAVASSIYFQKGKTEQYKYYIEQAQTAAGAAAQLSEEGEARKAWETAIFMAQKAETYQTTSESHSLILQAQTVLDQMDNIVRVDFANAIIGGLPAADKITRMEASQTDLYMLDASQGRVLRAVMTGHGYELDSSFRCSPGPYGSYIVSSFVDFRILPKGNSMDADVAAIDGGGNMVYCGPDITTTSITLAAPDNNWGSIKAMDYDSGSIYVLDTLNNAVWVYSGGASADGNRPELFFGDTVPAIGDVTDISANANDLYLLHADGHLTHCVKNKVTGESATCTNPTAYGLVDNKKANNPVIIPNTNFKMLSFVDPPDPALVILDAKGQMIYNFSVKMALHSKIGIRNASDLRIKSTQLPSGFTINSNRQVFIAFDNQVFYGQIN